MSLEQKTKPLDPVKADKDGNGYCITKTNSFENPVQFVLRKDFQERYINKSKSEES